MSSRRVTSFIPDDPDFLELRAVETPGYVQPPPAIVVDAVRNAGRKEDRGPRFAADGLVAHGEERRSLDHVVPLVGVWVVMEEVHVAGLVPGQPDHHPLRSAQPTRDDLDEPAAVARVAAGADPLRIVRVALIDDRLLRGDHRVARRRRRGVLGFPRHQATVLGSRGAMSCSTASQSVDRRPADWPPSTGMMLPYINDASSLSRKAMTSATSAGSPGRSSG